MLLTLPTSFAQLGYPSGVALQLFYGIVGCWATYMITWLYMEYRSRMEREGHTFKIHIIQVWSMLTSTLQSCCQVFLITCKLLGLLWITRSVRWWLTLMFNVICWRSQWFEVLDGLLGRKWKFLGLGFNCVYLLFSAITQLIACGRYLPIRASMSTFMHVLISL